MTCSMNRQPTRRNVKDEAWRRRWILVKHGYCAASMYDQMTFFTRLREQAVRDGQVDVADLVSAFTDWRVHVRPA